MTAPSTWIRRPHRNAKSTIHGSIPRWTARLLACRVMRISLAHPSLCIIASALVVVGTPSVGGGPTRVGYGEGAPIKKRKAENRFRPIFQAALHGIVTASLGPGAAT